MKTNLKDSQFTVKKTESCLKPIPPPSHPHFSFAVWAIPPGTQTDHPSLICKDFSVTCRPGKLELLIPAIAQGARTADRSLPLPSSCYIMSTLITATVCWEIEWHSIKENITQLTLHLALLFSHVAQYHLFYGTPSHQNHRSKSMCHSLA